MCKQIKWRGLRPRHLIEFNLFFRRVFLVCKIQPDEIDDLKDAERIENADDDEHCQMIPLAGFPECDQFPDN